MDIAAHTPAVVRTRTVGWGHEQGNRGWAVFRPGEETAGIGQMRQGLAALQATGGAVRRPLFLAFLAEAYGGIGQIKEGLHPLTEALAAVEHSGGRFYEAELHRLKRELLRARAAARCPCRAGASLAHRGVLCLDELPACRRRVTTSPLHRNPRSDLVLFA